MVTSTETPTKPSELLTDAAELRKQVESIMNSTAVMDVHTHLFPPEFNRLCLFGIDELLPKEITLLHGPGCPVCVTPVELVDQATQIAARAGVIFCSFGDMLRVPLTTISWSRAETGQQAAHLLIQLMSGESQASRTRKIILPPELVVRNSCGAKPLRKAPVSAAGRFTRFSK